MPRLSSGVASHTGHVREHNEDSALTGARIVAVADGMGGHAAGEVASRIVVDTLAEFDQLSSAGPDDVWRIIRRANDAIVRAETLEPAYAGMGTTVCGAALVSVDGHGCWAVFNVGDSRAYRYADGGLRQLTVDHTEVAELLAAGAISAQQARQHPLRNVLSRSLGTEPAPQPDVWVRPVVPGETLLFCSDGLTGEVGETQIAETLAAASGQAAADALVQQALTAGGHDNVTAVVTVLVDDAP